MSIWVSRSICHLWGDILPHSAISHVLRGVEDFDQEFHRRGSSNFHSGNMLRVRVQSVSMICRKTAHAPYVVGIPTDTHTYVQMHSIRTHMCRGPNSAQGGKS